MNSFRYFGVAAVCMLLAHHTSQGATERWTTSLRSTGIAANGLLHIHDPELNYVVLNPSTYQDRFVYERTTLQVRLRIDGDAEEVLSAGSLQVNGILHYRTLAAPNGPTVSVPITLVNSYTSPGTPEQDLAVHVQANVIWASFVVTSVTNNITPVPADAYLDLVLDVDRRYVLGPSEMPSVQRIEEEEGPFLHVWWDAVEGAVTYDLAWCFLDMGTATSADGLPLNMATATVINTAAHDYRIPLAYPRGMLVLRLRAIGEDPVTGERREGPWMEPCGGCTQYSENLISPLQRFYWPGLDPDHNWTYTGTYAERGLRKDLMRFFDGSGRGRQDITLLNSDGHSLLNNHVYDVVGRPSLQFLPYPVAGRSLRWRPDQLLIGGTDHYDFADFDTELTTDAPTLVGATVPAGAYWSPGGNVLGTHGAYVPDAGGRPYTRTLYHNDGTGRVRETRAAGDDMADHPTRVFYGRPGSQLELDRLFGNEVGLVQHYVKQVTEDPNHQLSVSYLDAQGRTVATALAGAAPAGILPIDTYPEQVEQAVEGALPSTVEERGSVTNHTFPLSTSSALTFTYTLDPATFTECINAVCTYRLRIRITDDCGALVPMAGNAPNPAEFSGTAEQINAAMAALAPYATATLGPGVYTVEKVLALDDVALADHLAAYDAVYGLGTCHPFPSLPPQPCDCPGLCAQTYSLQNADGTTSWLNADLEPTTDEAAHQAAVQACVDACNADPELPGTCEAKLDQLMADMSPAGQYLDNRPMLALANGSYNENAYPINAWVQANIGSAPPTTLPEGGPAPWGTTTWAQLRANWVESYAAALVQFHPERCQYTHYCKSLCTKRNTGGGNEVQCTVPFHGTGSYDEAMHQAGTQDAALRIMSGHTLRYLFNPVGTAFENNPQDHTTYQPIPVPAAAEQDELITCWTLNGELCTLDVDISERLMHFLPDGNGEWLTIWYLLEDPQHHAWANSSPFPAEVHELFKTIHGTCPTCTDGIIPSGQMTQYQLFRGIYTYYRELLAYRVFNGANADCQAHLDGPDCPDFLANGDTPGFTATDFAIRYPQDPVMNGFDPTAEGAGALVDQILLDMDAEYTNGQGLPDPDVDPNALPTNCACDGLQALLDGQGVNTGDGISAVELEQINDVWADLSPDENAPLPPLDLTQLQAWLDACAADPESVSGLPVAFNCPDLVPDAYDCATISGQQVLADEVIARAQARAEAMQAFTAGYTATCMGGLAQREHFTMRYILSEYHYTLYYYDQAGNLIKTIPPNGVPAVGDQHNRLIFGSDVGQPATPEAAQLHRIDPVNNAFVRRHSVNATVYTFDSFQHPRIQRTPNTGGNSTFFYDQLGRLVASEDPAQANGAGLDYSYTLYDPLGRPEEAGVFISDVALTEDIVRDADPNYVDGLPPLVAASAQPRREVVRTHYSTALATPGLAAQFGAGGQRNTRARVTAAAYHDTYTGEPDDLNYQHATHYSYDIHGNVATLVQDLPELAGLVQRFKRLVYRYDLVSGRVNSVHYQPGQWDQHHHRYRYDADGRLLEAQSSRDSVIWERDARYFYYAHGPLARTELGERQVQGTDHTYTLQGWLHAVNSPSLRADRDPGRDGAPGANELHRHFGADASGFGLQYHLQDYSPVVAVPDPLPGLSGSGLFVDLGARQLYNGNIPVVYSGLRNTQGEALPQLGNLYTYDQLNRLRKSTTYIPAEPDATAWHNVSPGSAWATEYGYDGNGNLKRLVRRDAGGVLMDDLAYAYSAAAVPDQLATLSDAVATSAPQDDLEDLGGPNGYTYTARGELETEAWAAIGAARWTQAGKLRRVERNGNSVNGGYPADLAFRYDAAGHRVSKTEKPWDNNGSLLAEEDWTTTFYIRDAQGEPMAIYERTYEPVGANWRERLTLTELPLYGSSRLGLRREQMDRTVVFSATDVTATQPTAAGVYESYLGARNYGPPTYVAPAGPAFQRQRATKHYELTDHLGNVRAVVSDRKRATNNGGFQFLATVESFSEYYPFGSLLQGRHEASNTYRFGFQGQEKNDEIHGATGTSYAFEYRMHDPRVGRFLSIDPLAAEYPWNSPYSFAENKVIQFIELEGLETAPSGANSGTEDLKMHEVQSGESTWGIAKSNLPEGSTNSDISTLSSNIIKWNGLGADGHIEPGKKLALFDPVATNDRLVQNAEQAASETKTIIRRAEFEHSQFQLDVKIYQSYLKIDEDLAALNRQQATEGLFWTGATLGVGGALRLARPWIGSAGNWLRLGNTYRNNAPVFALRWGSNAHYAEGIGLPFLRSLNQSLRGSRIPLNGWRFRDAGHFYIRDGHVWWW